MYKSTVARDSDHSSPVFALPDSSSRNFKQVLITQLHEARDETMHFTIQREALLKPLQLVAGVVERRQTLPVLSNVLLVVEGQQLSLTGTDLEVELVGRVALEDAAEPGEITVPARKLMDICKSLPSDAMIDIRVDEQKLLVKAGRSRFSLSTLPANDFPTVEEGPGSLTFDLVQGKLRRLIERTSFAMAQQDVRYYLNGMLLEVQTGVLRAVATDGHRLAMCAMSAAIEQVERHQVIVPRKGILELARLLTEQDGNVSIVLGQHHIRATTGEFTFTSKLVDGKFPDYERVLPRGGDKVVIADRQGLREAFSRTAILSNEKYRGIRLQLASSLLKIQANNPEQEEAEEEIVVDYTGSTLEIGFNVSYLLDVLGVMTTDQVRLILSDANSSALVQEADNDDSSYVVMPMRL
ncbi:DNA polymerase-3 subunit beta [Pseudomonas cuatrocienegasensis]|uniref:Beta sliding clamp n=2 Tax=Pseudomonas TaxID=286 RepID=A0ABY1BHS2_9PSED|nr:DNA polymerase-3 subunit beta [Pseudomonas cuatrocienegasensis]